MRPNQFFLMTSLDEIKSVVAPELEAMNAECDRFLSAYGGLAHEVLDYSSEVRGKQIRAILLLLTSRLFGPATQESIRLAAFVETMHAASLFHDDVVDGSSMRRGQKSVNAVWDNRTAILTGDLLIASLFAKSTAEYGPESAILFADTIQKMSESELKQIERERVVDYDEDSYFEIINGKTATLMSTCCSLAARQAKAPQEVVDTLTEFGRLFGVAFQLRDDMLDFEKNGSIGKPVGADLSAGNITLPAIYYLNRLDEYDRNAVLKQIKDGKNLSSIVVDIRCSKAMEDARRTMRDYSSKALKVLDSLSQYDTTLLRQLLEVVVERSY